MKPVQEQFDTFIEFERAWHEWVMTTKMKDNELYLDGQFDEIPYYMWDKNVMEWRSF